MFTTFFDEEKRLYNPKDHCFLDYIFAIKKRGQNTTENGRSPEHRTMMM